MKLKAVLFDHDGTLVDSEEIHYRIWQPILSRHCVDLSVEDYVNFHAGIPTRKNAETFVEKYRLILSPSVLAEEKEMATRDYLKSTIYPLASHAIETILFLRKRDVRLAVVSGADRVGVETTLQGHDLGKYFDVVVSGDDVQRSKPAPDVYLLAVERLHLTAQECLAVEDTTNGVTSAVGAGLACCGIRTKYSLKHDFSAAATVVRNMDELRHWVAERYYSGEST